MKHLLCIGGPIDGEVKPIEDYRCELLVATAAPLRLKLSGEDMGKNAYTEHKYERLRLDHDIEFLYYAPDGPIRAFRNLLACYAPRLARLAQDEQRRLERQIPPSDLPAERRRHQQKDS